MGAGEESSTAKHSKPTVTQETHPPSYADWTSSMQAYYGAGSPAPHPYMWGGQHPMMPPYGTPLPYPPIYPPAGFYPHPGMPTTPSTPLPAAEMEPKARKGSLGNVNVAVTSSGNDGTTKSAESENNGSSDGAGNVNMRIDLWNPSPGNIGVEMQQNPSRASQTVVPPPMMPDQWARQDERELKRQKRKQSNRESARKSRMRKQAECEELQERVQVLSHENHTLKDELQRLSEECKKLKSENNSIKDKLSKCGEPKAMSKLDGNLESQADEGDN